MLVARMRAVVCSVVSCVLLFVAASKDGCGGAPEGRDAPRCHMCQDHLALWCTSCSTQEQLASGTCSKCWSRTSSCEYCHTETSKQMTAWRKCRASDCRRSTYVCDHCVTRFAKEEPLCKPCWIAGERKCITCGEAQAQNERK